MRRTLIALLAGLLTTQGCEDATPTSTDGGQLPVEAVTIELRIPFSEFASDFQLFDGFGSTALLGSIVLAHEWEGGVEARGLFRFIGLPSFIFVFPPGSNITARDSTFVPISGSVTLQMDTLGPRGVPPYALEAGVIETPWHAPSANWELTVDTLGTQIPWPEAGAGPLSHSGVGNWDPFSTVGGTGSEDVAQVTEVAIPLDSTAITALVDTTVVTRSVRVSSLQPDSWLRIRAAELQVKVRSSVNPDTVVTLALPLSAIAMVQTPEPSLDPSAFPIGGAPAVRATFRMQLPESVAGSEAICAVVTCPVDLLPERLVYAGLELHTAESTPPGLRPLDDAVLELRPVLSADRLPRSPLGFPLACPTGECAMTLPSTTVQEDFFTSDVGTRIAMPMTRYVRDLLRGESTVPSTIALMYGLNPATGLEMRPLEYATFWGPGTELEPMLRLILTVSDGVPLP